jgi:hypothetical protein
MLNGHRSAWRGRGRNSRAARIAVPLAIPMALGLTLGVVLVVSGGKPTQIDQSALGSCANPAASTSAAADQSRSGSGQGGQSGNGWGQGGGQSGNGWGQGGGQSGNGSGRGGQSGNGSGWGDPSATASASSDPSATVSASADPSATTTATASADPTGSASPSADPCPSASASGTPADPASPTATPSATATAAATNVNCDIIVPANPLSAQGLATPYQLTGTDGESPAASGCEMTNAVNLGAFVQATILNPANGQLFVYDPLVVTQGTTPAVSPPVPTLPPNAIVTVDFGFNGTDLFQVGATPNALAQGNCVNGQPGSVFGQVSFCNGVNFFNTAFRLEREGLLHVPSEGTSSKIIPTDGTLGTGTDCPVTRNFDMVDQDPSDNVTTEYLLNPATGQTMEDSTANADNYPNSTLLVNGSDNTLLDLFIDPVLGCTPFQVPTLSNNGLPGSSQALDELLSAKNQPRIVALVPENDEMVLNGNDQFDAAKTDLYREEVGQAPINFQNNQTSSPAMYCQNIVNIQTPFLAANQTLLATGQPPVPGVGDNLFTFMANRLSMSFTNLNCQNFGLTNPVTVTLDSQGVAVAATFNTTMQTATNTTGTATPSASPSTSTVPGWGHRRGRPHHQFMNPSGM